jgi:Mycobacterium membrane protein
VVWGSVRDVEPARFDVAVESGQDASQPHGPRRVLFRRARQPSSAPRVEDGYRYGKSRRNPGPVIFRFLGRLWIPLVVLVVIAVGGLTVSRLHGLFGSAKSPSYADTKVDNKPYNPQHIKYEVFGPPGTVALISYFDDNGSPQHVDGASLPWSLEFPITAATGIGNVAAQGDNDSIGCRILVDGVVKAEKITHEVSAFTSCMLTAS